MSTVSDTVEHSDKGNTKTLSRRSRGWCFTINNYSEQEEKILHTYTAIFEKMIVGKETGENGTPHLQGYAYAKNAKTFAQMKKLFPRGHLEPAKGKPVENRVYCSKGGQVIIDQGFDEPVKMVEKLREKCLRKYDGVVWKTWQEQVLAIAQSSADTRSIHWFVDYYGNTGKSFLCKYLCLKYDCIIADGKKDNILNQLKTCIVDEDKEPRIIILDVPRESLDYINYGVLEQLKNGLVYSGKYEGAQLIFDNVHVLVFANEDPKNDAYSKDRLKVVDVTDYSEIENLEFSEERTTPGDPKKTRLLSDEHGGYYPPGGAVLISSASFSSGAAHPYVEGKTEEFNCHDNQDGMYQLLLEDLLTPSELEPHIDHFSEYLKRPSHCSEYACRTYESLSPLEREYLQLPGSE